MMRTFSQPLPPLARRNWVSALVAMSALGLEPHRASTPPLAIVTLAGYMPFVASRNGASSSAVTSPAKRKSGYGPLAAPPPASVVPACPDAPALETPPPDPLRPASAGVPLVPARFNALPAWPPLPRASAPPAPSSCAKPPLPALVDPAAPVAPRPPSAPAPPLATWLAPASFAAAAPEFTAPEPAMPAPGVPRAALAPVALVPAAPDADDSGARAPLQPFTTASA